MENKSGQSYVCSYVIQNSLSDTLVPLSQAETFHSREQKGVHSSALTHLKTRSHFKDIVTGENGQGHKIVNEKHSHQGLPWAAWQENAKSLSEGGPGLLMALPKPCQGPS